jgi:UDPglucose 6-dehydrogenase
MKQTTIGVIGQGFVGNAIYQGFKDYYDVLTYDKYIEEKSNSTLEDLVINSYIIFSCVPTPMTDVGQCYTGIVEEVLEGVNDICKKNNIVDQIVVIKSTVIPGTTKKMNDKFSHLNVVFNPEFLTEANAVNDWKNQNRIILGGLNKVTAKVKPIFKKVFPQVPIVKTDSKYAEMVKYVINTFLATKVSFANEIYQICDEMKIDYDKVIEYAQYDERLGKSHWSVPGPDGDYGFGGHCFPKDVQAMMYEAFQLGVEPTILAATIAKNNMVREERDWEEMDGRAIIRTNNFETVSSYTSIEELRDTMVDENQLKLDI